MRCFGNPGTVGVQGGANAFRQVESTVGQSGRPALGPSEGSDSGGTRILAGARNVGQFWRLLCPVRVRALTSLWGKNPRLAAHARGRYFRRPVGPSVGSDRPAARTLTRRVVRRSRAIA